MADTRTWWRRGTEYDYQSRCLETCELLCSVLREADLDFGSAEIHIDDIDCMEEQLWAIREGLADRLEKETRG